MRLDIILGVNIDTSVWIRELKISRRKNIIVIDYNHKDIAYEIDNVMYMSEKEGNEYSQYFDELFFYKSLYCYPILNGKRQAF